MATNTYYSPFFPATEVVGTKGTTIAVVPSAVVGGVQDEIDKINDKLENIGEGGTVDNTPPGAVTNLAVSSNITDNGAEMLITWTPPSDDDLAGFDVAVAEGTGTFIRFTTSGFSYKISALKRNQLYKVQVRAFDRVANPGVWTEIVEHTTARDTVPPSKPNIVTVEAAYESANVRWTNGNEADLDHTRITLYRNGNPIDGTIVKASVGGGSTFFANLSKATTYAVIAQVFDTSGNASEYSSAYVFTTAGGIDLNDFTPGLTPITTVTSLPSLIGYSGTPTVMYQGRLYTAKDGTWKPANEIDPGQVKSENLFDGAVIASKLAAKVGGGNLLRNSGFGLDRTYQIVPGKMPNGFAHYDNSGGSETNFVDTRAGGRTSNFFLINYNANTSTKGVYPFNSGSPNNTSLTKPNTTYVVSWYARGSGSASTSGMHLNYNVQPVSSVILSNPTLNGEWQRYAYRITTGSNPDTNSFYITVSAFGGAGVVDICDIQLEEGEVLTSYKLGLFEGEVTANMIAANAVTADKVLANSIAANKLTISTRPFTTSGVNVRINNLGECVWDAGTVTVINNDGTQNTYAITAGRLYGKYLVYYPGSPTFDQTNDSGVLTDSTANVVAVWNGGSDLIVKAGVSTQINGDRISTGTLTATQIATQTISADKMVLGTLTAAQIATGALTARVLAIGNPDNIITDGNFNDASWWNSNTPDGRLAVGETVEFYNTVRFQQSARCLKISPSGGMDFFSKAFTMETGASYKISISVYTSPNFSGYFCPILHVPNVGWLALKSNEYIDPGQRSASRDFTVANVASGPIDTVFDNPTWAGGYNAYSNVRLIGAFTGEVLFAVKMVRVSDSTLIRDGAITTDKITVGTLNGDRISAGTLDANKIKANSVIANDVWVGSVDGGARQLETIVQRSNNPAAQVNAMSPFTLITPGAISVGGSSTLNSWRNGVDSAEIRGGAVAANTISANKLTIGNRGISIQGIDFSYNRIDGRLYWTSGLIFYVNDAGVATYANIPAGNTAPGFGSGGIQYIWWPKDGTQLYTSVDNWPTLIAGDYIVMCQWTGGAGFVANYGGTIIDGDRITTGSIAANRLNVTQLSAITADVGLLRTAASGGRMEIENNQIRIFDDSGAIIGYIGRLP